MKKLFFTSHAIFLLPAFLFLASCCGKRTGTTGTSAGEKTTNTQTVVATQAKDFEKEGYTKAMVIYFELDGCKFLLQLENEKKLEPVNLSEDFKKDQLPVWIKYGIKKNAISICQVGEIVELADIQIRK